MKNITDEEWRKRVDDANKARMKLKGKPKHLRLGFRFSPGGIINAYREGDLTFNQAVRELEKWKKSDNKGGFS